MFPHRRKDSVGSVAARGLLFDRQIRRAAIQSAAPLARLSFGVSRRMARRRAQRRWDQIAPTINALTSLAATFGPHLAEQFGIVEPPRRTSRVAPKLAIGALVGAGAFYLLEPQHGPEHRRQVQRLIAH